MQKKTISGEVIALGKEKNGFDNHRIPVKNICLINMQQ